jgi:ATP-dependent RNA helicase HelY
VVGLAAQAQRSRDALEAYGESMGCHLGDFGEYFGLRRAIKEREAFLARSGAAARRAATVESLENLAIGDVITIPAGRRAGVAVVLDPGLQALGEPRPLVLTGDRWAGRISAADFSEEAEVLTRIRIPRHFNHRSPQARRDLASSLRTAASRSPGGPSPTHRGGGRDDGRDDRRDEAPPRRKRTRSAAADDTTLADLRAAMRRHPCHGCAEREEHARWAERRDRLERETVALEERVHSRTNSLARTFDKVCDVLTARGYLTGVPGGESVITSAGRGLSRIWSESDLLVAECLRAQVWEGLSPAELAGAVSALVYEARRPEEGTTPVPNGPLREALLTTARLAAELRADEAGRGLSLTREPDAGFVWPVYRWARGEALPRVLAAASGVDGEMPAGDFVRWCRQVLDLLDQVAAASPADSGVRLAARSAIDATRRGVVLSVPASLAGTPAPASLAGTPAPELGMLDEPEAPAVPEPDAGDPVPHPLTG